MARKLSLTNSQVHMVVEATWYTWTRSQENLDDSVFNAEYHQAQVDSHEPGSKRREEHASLLRVYQRDAWQAWDRLHDARSILVKLGQDVPQVEEVANQPPFPRPEAW